MYLEQCLARDRTAERLQRARDARRASRAAELGRLERRQERAERELPSAWQRVDDLRSELDSVS